MGNSCNKPSVNKRKIFTLHKITDKNESKVDEVGNQFELENPSELPNNNFPRRKSSFYHNTNQSNGKVTFNENAARSNATMKRNSFQPPAFQHRLIRETSSVEKRRTSDGNKMINEYEIGCKLGEGSFGKVKMVTRKFLGYEQRYATKIFKKNILKRINEFRKDEDGSYFLFFS